MADDILFQAAIDGRTAVRIDKQCARYGWTRKEFFRRIVLDALPRLESSTPPLIPEAEPVAE